MALDIRSLLECLVRKIFGVNNISMLRDTIMTQIIHILSYW